MKSSLDPTAGRPDRARLAVGAVLALAAAALHAAGAGPADGAPPEPTAPAPSASDAVTARPLPPPPPPAAPGAGPKADGPGQATRDSGRLVVRLLTFGTGGRVWEKFGHNALWIRDTGSGREVVYNWGIFDFEQEDFFVRLLTGRMRYRVARSSLEQTLRIYRADRRTIRVQRLRLGPAQAREVARRARVNLLPENRHYAYDPFRDNCSTRIRDLLDRVLDGAIREQTAGVETGETYRSHTRRLLRRVEWAYAGIMAFLGSSTDRRLSAWDEMFLPVRMDDLLQEVRVEADDGGTVPLASEPRALYRADRPPLPGETPGFGLRYLAGGLAGGGLLALLGLLAGRGRSGAGRGYRAVAVLWSVAAGAAGVVAVGGWALTGHWYVHLNENVFQLHPVSLALAAALPMAGRPGRARRVALGLARATAAVALLGLALQALPGVDQVNGEILALAVPLHLGTAAGLEAWARGPAGEGS